MHISRLESSSLFRRFDFCSEKMFSVSRSWYSNCENWMASYVISIALSSLTHAHRKTSSPGKTRSGPRGHADKDNYK